MHLRFQVQKAEEALAELGDKPSDSPVPPVACPTTGQLPSDPPDRIAADTAHSNPLGHGIGAPLQQETVAATNRKASPLEAMQYLQQRLRAAEAIADTQTKRRRCCSRHTAPCLAPVAVKEPCHDAGAFAGAMPAETLCTADTCGCLAKKQPGPCPSGRPMRASPCSGGFVP